MDSMGVEDAPRVHVISDARLSAFSGRSRALERSASRDEGAQGRCRPDNPDHPRAPEDFSSLWEETVRLNRP